ncbi:MAG: HEAT repeat domain-containing protein [Gemmataceae bacterium]|nr:HEAT repeat domain-containing protein [Gemmataceae bacterium]
MRKRIIRRVLALLALALVGAALVVPYYRQLLFGPKHQGVPLCVWQDQLRRQTLGDNDPGWLAKVRKWFQPKADSLAKIELTREDRIAIWFTFLDDPVPGMRVRAVQALWGSHHHHWGSTLWGEKYVSFLYRDTIALSGTRTVYVQSVRASNIRISGTILWDGTQSVVGFSAGPIDPPPPVAPHLIRMLDDPSADVRQAAFGALNAQGKEAAPAFPRLFELLGHDDPTRRTLAAQALNATHPKTPPWLERLMAILDDPHADVRRTAVGCLNHWNDRRMAVAAGPRLVHALRDPDPTIRMQAATTLGTLDVYRAEATKALRTALRHPESSVRVRALGNLFASAGAALYPDLVQCARFDPVHDVRTTAVGALYHGGAQAVPVLVSFLRHSNGEMRNAAVQGLRNLGPKARLAVPHLLADLERFAANGVQPLADIGDPDAVPKLIELLEHRELRGPAVAALHALGVHARASIPKLRQVLDEQPDLRQQAFQALLAIGGDDEQVFKALEKRVLTDIAAKRDDLVWSLCQLGARARALVPALIQRLEARDSASSDQAQVQMLGAIGPAARSAVPALLRLANSRNEDTRSAVIAALGNIAAEADLAVPWLIAQLEHDQHVVAAAHALAQFGPRARPAWPHLLPLLRSARADFRNAAMWALAAVGPAEEAAAALAPHLRDRNEGIRSTAAEALCSLGARHAVKHVVPLLRDETETIRGAVARALGALGPDATAAVPALIELLDDDSQTIHDYALDALARIEP